MRISFNYLIILLLTLLIYSCNPSGDQFSSGSDFININSNIVLVDTCSAITSTVVYDSTVTSGKGVALVGGFKDGDLGFITSKSYFLITKPISTVTTDKLLTLDSITLLMKGNGYYYGDTTKSRTINVYRVTENIIINPDYNNIINPNGNLYNVSNYSFDPQPLGSIKLNRRTYKNEIVEIHLNPKLGQDFLDSMNNRQGKIFTSDAKFIGYFKGICLAADNNENTMINGYSASRADMKIRLYYKIQADLYPTQYKSDFQLTDSAFQFNQISVDTSTTILTKNHGVHNLIGTQISSQTPNLNNKSFVQAGRGIVTKIEFPYLKGLSQLSSYGAILRADLIIKPMIGSYYGSASLPSTLNLRYTDYSNTMGSPVTNSAGSNLTGNLIVDALYGINTEYSFDITSFVQSLVRSANTTNSALLLVPPTSAINSTLEKLTINNTNLSKDRIGLRIYLMRAN